MMSGWIVVALLLTAPFWMGGLEILARWLRRMSVPQEVVLGPHQ